MIMTARTLLCAGAALLSFIPQHASAQGGFNGPGRYEIMNLKSRKVIDLDRNDQNSVIQWSSRGSDNQTWIIRPARDGFFYIRNTMNGSALECISPNNGTQVRGLPFNGGPAQQWRFQNGKDGNALIVSRLGKGLDVPDGSDRDGIRIQTFDVNGDSNQRFIFRRVNGWGNGNWGGGNEWSEGGGRPERGDGNRPPNDGGRPPNIITCSSNDGRRNYCDTDTRGGVRMVRQISGSACERGRTWDYDRRGIWVDRGCRADFELGRRER
jgi:Protein of unknown function (DUF3011)/Ricin-type beta-trefoil lectin domain-like